MTSPPMNPTDPEQLVVTLADWMLDGSVPQVSRRTAQRRLLALLDVLPLTAREALLVRHNMLRPESSSERAMRKAALDRRAARAS